MTHDRTLHSMKVGSGDSKLREGLFFEEFHHERFVETATRFFLEERLLDD